MGVLSRVNAIAAAATVAGVIAAPSAALAWDWPWAGWFADDAAMEPSAIAVDDTPVTFGTGWYLRGDMSISGETQIPIGNVILPTTKTFPNNYALGLGFGYKYNAWLRTDVTLDYRAGRQFQGNTTRGVIPCQDGAVGTPVGGPFTGSIPIYGSCLDYVQARMNNTQVMFNAYADLGTWYGLTPYVGAGIGFNLNYQRFQRTWYFNNGNPYSGTSWVDPWTGGTYSNYWDSKQSTSTMQFAWAVMGGASYNVTPHLAVDLGLRYSNLGSVYTTTVFGSYKQNYSATDARIGFRYTPD
ncbi:MAG: outer membrane beta-barrel protein [Beijerinckiaceae bacterium]